MPFEIRQEFLFDAAHRFPGTPRGHKYHGVHGHTFRVEVCIVGEPAGRHGFVVDLAELEQACNRLRGKLDHANLNDIPGLRAPSLENIAVWIWNRLSRKYPGLSRVSVSRDSSRHGCSYSGPPPRAGKRSR